MSIKSRIEQIEKAAGGSDWPQVIELIYVDWQTMEPLPAELQDRPLFIKRGPRQPWQTIERGELENERD